MKYAIIKNEIVTNIVRSDSALLSNWIAIPDDQSVQIDDSYIDSSFVSNTQEQTPVITINALVNGQTFISAALGETVDYTASFSDKTLNIPKLEISVVDRAGGLIENLSMTVVDGEGTGSLIVDKKIDYLLTNTGINFHKQAIPVELKLVSELVVRVSL